MTCEAGDVCGRGFNRQGARAARIGWDFVFFLSTLASDGALAVPLRRRFAGFVRPAVVDAKVAT
jgi:hypothetical protein